MKIDKAKLMKRAWEIAKHGFYNAALRSIVGKDNFSEKFIVGCCRDRLNGKKNFFELKHVQKVMDIDFTSRDFLAESLKMAWVEAKKTEKIEIKKTLREIEREHADKKMMEKEKAIAKINKNAPRRELIPAGKFSEGQKLYGFVITGLGREFRPNVDMFSMGLTPDTEYAQYAYFN